MFSKRKTACSHNKRNRKTVYNAHHNLIRKESELASSSALLQTSRRLSSTNKSRTTQSLRTVITKYAPLENGFLSYQEKPLNTFFVSLSIMLQAQSVGIMRTAPSSTLKQQSPFPRSRPSVRPVILRLLFCLYLFRYSLSFPVVKPNYSAVLVLPALNNDAAAFERARYRVGDVISD